MSKRLAAVFLFTVTLFVLFTACETTPEKEEIYDVNKFGGEKMVYLIDTSNFNEAEKTSVTALQGLANRMGPKILLLPGKSSYASKFKSGALEGAYPPGYYDQYQYIENVWAEYYAKEYDLTFKQVTLNEAFEIFSDMIKYTIDYDVLLNDNGIIHESPSAPGLVLTTAGVYDAIPYPNAVKNKHPALKDKKIINYKGKFKDKYEAGAWAVQNLLDKCSKEMAASCFTETEAGTYLADLAVMKKGFVFKLNFVNSENKEHAALDGDTMNVKDVAVLDKIFEHLDEFGYIWGWGFGGENALASRVAMSSLTMINGNLPNGSFHASIKPKTEPDFKQAHVNIDDVKVENKIYIASVMGAGDTYQAMGSFMDSGYWLMSDRGNTPFTWAINPMLYKIMPAMMQYFYQTKTDNDYFSAASAGYGYFHPSFFDKKNQDKLADKVNEFRQLADFKYIDIWWFSMQDDKGNDIRWDWLKKTGYEGITQWDNQNRVTYEAHGIPAVRSKLYFPFFMKYNTNEITGDQKGRAKDMTECIIEGTKNLPKDSPFCTVIYATSPWCSAEMQKLLPMDRYEFVTLDKLFAITQKAQTKLLQTPDINFSFAE